ncbi:hypothetical protein CK203_103512 [Vitis vinifera]|uniref:EXS domain-containing protein n=1 Tax=Vitis vinifera TaxID=29760 RepID=A0A438CQM0_VITVI|nr:hypothetical protein CK203_103512 [Vitis vinifera]
MLSCHLPQVLLYTAIALVLIFPFDIFYLSSRYFLLKTLWRIVLPLQAITFSDFFLADILTSMAKVCNPVCSFRHYLDYPVLVVVDVVSTLKFDSPWRVHRAWPWKVPWYFQIWNDLSVECCIDSSIPSHWPLLLLIFKHMQVATIAWFEADSVCGSHSVAIPLVLVLPYLFRFFQCLRQYKDTGEKTTLLNALKYSTAVPVIFLSALKYHVFPDRWTSIYRPLWLLSSVLNSLYSFYWDVTRDWDLSFSASPTHSTLKLNLLLFYHLCLNLSSLLNSAFTRIFKFSKASLLSNLLYGRRWVSNVYCIFLGDRKQSGPAMHMDIQAVCPSSAQLPNCLHNHCLGDISTLPMVFFRVENEWNKMNSKSNIQLSMSDTSEEDKLLGSNERNV